MTDSDTFFHFDNTHQPDQFPELYREKSFEGFPNQDSQHFIPPESNLDNLFQYVPESDSYEPTEHRNVETLSNYSASSTNCSSKLSPPYNQGEEDHKDPKGNKDSAPILKKKIHKYYEPIKDGNVTYRYEDDPVEYKKARKRIQNRESAARVRSRKKDHMGDLEEEFQELKKENEELKVKNASLSAENNLLKQQVQFLEKMVLKSTGSTAAPDLQDEPELPITIKPDEQKKPGISIGIFRPAPVHTFKKHVTMLSVVTIMICISYGIVAHTPMSGGGMDYPGLAKFKSISFSPQGVDDYSQKLDKSDIEQIHALVDEVTLFNSIKSVLKWGSIVVYLVYFGFVVSITNWGYLLSSKKKKNL